MNSHFRSRALLDLAYELPCTLRLDGCLVRPCEPAHSNQSRHGKGGSIKAHDVFFAAACRNCHVEIDQGKRMTREQRFDVWQRGHEETLLTLWQYGLIGVTR